MVGKHAVFDPAMLQTPAIDEAFRAPAGRTGDCACVIKRRNALSTVTYPFNPLDAVGWHGDLAPVRLNVARHPPADGHRYHLPPSRAHHLRRAPLRRLHLHARGRSRPIPARSRCPSSTTTTTTTRCCSTTPATSSRRDNIHAGMMTLHPCGFTHGPHPKALGNAFTPKKPATDEYAVMLDTQRCPGDRRAPRSAWSGRTTPIPGA